MFPGSNLIAHFTVALIFFNLKDNAADAGNHMGPQRNTSYTKIMWVNEFENNNKMIASCVADVLKATRYTFRSEILISHYSSNSSVLFILGDLVNKVLQHDVMIPIFFPFPEKRLGFVHLRMIFVDSYDSFWKIVQQFRNKPKVQNYKLYCLFVLMVPDYTTIAPINDMQKIFQLLFEHRGLDVNIMVATSKKVKTYTFYPYTYGECGSTRPVLLDTCSENNEGFRRQSLFPSKKHNMNLCPFETLTTHLPPFIIENKPLNGEDSLTGIDGDILKIISRKLNFSIALSTPSYDIGGTVYDNGTSTGMYKLLNQREADIGLGYCECTPNRMRYLASTKPYYRTSLRILLKDPEGYSPLETIFFPFSTQTWIMLIVINFIRIILLILKHHKYAKYLPKATPKLIFITWCFITLTFRSSYESLFFKFMLHKTSKPLPRSFDDLRNQNYKIYTDVITGLTAQNIPELNGMLIIVNKTPYEVLREFENSPSNRRGILTNIDTFSYFVTNESIQFEGYVNLNIISLDQMFCMYYQHLSDFTDEFNKRISQLDTFGLLPQIAQKFIKSIDIPNDYRTRRATSDKILSLHHLTGPVKILAVLHAIACGVFILELLFGFLQNKYCT